MIIKMLNIFDFDPETGIYTPITSEIIDENIQVEKPKSKSSSTVKIKTNLPSDQSFIEREDNKLVLNQLALNSLGLEAGDTVSIKFDKKGKVTIPMIGKDENLGCKGGNKVTKTGTISCRGKTNEMLAEYGTIFLLVPHSERPNVFNMIDSSKEGEIPLQDDDNIENDDIDLDNIDFDLEVDLKEEDKKSLEITEFTFQ